MRRTNLPRARGRRGHSVQGAVQAAVAATYRTRPGVGAHAGEHAVWWFRNSDTLNLIADNEVDPVRAEAARADAVTARRLAEGMAAAHTSQVGQSALPAVHRRIRRRRGGAGCRRAAGGRRAAGCRRVRRVGGRPVSGQETPGLVFDLASDPAPASSGDAWGSLREIGGWWA
jgi:hypothetical protein